MKYDKETSLGILRYSHQSQIAVRATFALISEINKINVTLHAMKTSGTLKNLIEIIRKKEG